MRAFQFVLAIILIAISFSAISADTKYVAAETAAVYLSPDGKIVDQLRRGSEVEVYASSGSWSRISADKQKPRWVHTNLLCSTPTCWLAGPPPVHNSRLSPTPRSTYNSDSSCPCSGSRVCIGPRGGRYCITSGGKKRYGV